MVVSRMAFLMIVLLFLSTTGCSGNEAGNLRVGRGRRSLTTAALSSSSSSSQETSSSFSSQQITDTVNKAIQDLNHAKEEQVKTNMEDFDSILPAFAVDLTDTLRSMFVGAPSPRPAILNDDEILELVNQIKAEFHDQAQTELEGKAKLIVDNKMNELESFVQQDEGEGVSVKGIQEDIFQLKRALVEDLKESINDAAGTMQESMKEKSPRLVTTVTEATLKAKYGDRFTVTLAQDQDQDGWMCIEESNHSYYFRAQLPSYSQQQLDRITEMVNKAGQDLDTATADQVQANLGNFDRILTAFAANLMISIQSTLLDDGTGTPPATFSADELLELVEQIKAELHDQAQTELEKKAKDIAEDKKIGIDVVRYMDEYLEFRVKAIQDNITQAERASVEEMKEMVDEAATMMEEKMQVEAPQLVATAVEKKIKKKYGNRFTVRVEEGFVYIFEEGDSSIGFSVQLMGGDGQGESATEEEESSTDGSAQEVDQNLWNAYSYSRSRTFNG